MTTRVIITHGQEDSPFVLRITDYNGTKEVCARQSGEFWIHSDSTITIEEFIPEVAAPVVEELPPPPPDPETEQTDADAVPDSTADADAGEEEADSEIGE